ncbi:ankyrin repeat domain-containing protein [Endozoicomonas sp. YOMI1]|uniref:ankyrin repeat domain-containing protein n=1 Tax=Endozoicomonas sp. YOMI1 TaxID=2828739 RepID=UPI002148756D|nr:ankyrin repeat domain-containing protein [Endozoicomonas sp. YOMI1]
MNIPQSNGTVPDCSGNALKSLKRPSSDISASESSPRKVLNRAVSTISANCTQSNNITNDLFGTNQNIVFQASTGNFLPPDLKHKLLEIHQQSSTHFSENPHGSPVYLRNIELIRAAPILAQTDCFFEQLNSHAIEFCKNINRTHSIDIQMALWDAGPFTTLLDIGKFLEFILDKHNNKHHITYNEKIAFKFLLSGLLKMDHNLDADNSSQILETLSNYFPPDKIGKYCELYSCILSKGLSLAKVIKDVWSINSTAKFSIQKNDVFDMSVEQLITLITKLSENKNKIPNVADRYQFRQNIKVRLSTLNSINQKETLLMTLIKYNEQALLEVLMDREDFNINELTVIGETPLIYAIKQRSQWIIDFLINKQDINTLGLEGKTPLQIAIGCYSKYLDEDKLSDCCNPYKPVIESLLNCHQLNVDGKDSVGMTALCHIAMLPKLDSTCFSFIEKLKSRGANVEQSVQGHGTVLGLLGKKLKPEFKC